MEPVCPRFWARLRWTGSGQSVSVRKPGFGHSGYDRGMMDGLGVVSHPNLGERWKNEMMVTASAGLASSEI